MRVLAREVHGSGCSLVVRLRRLGALLLAGTTQLLDRGRLLIIALPLTFDAALRWSFDWRLGALSTAAVAGLSVGFVFFTWGLLVGHSFHFSLREYPATTRAFLHNHPAAVGVISTAIDGFPRSRDEFDELNGPHWSQYEFGPYATRRTIPGKALLALSRGAKTAFIFGTTAHVGVATISGFSDLAVRRRTIVVAIEAAAILAMIAAVVSMLVSHDFLGVAERIRDTITDRRVLITTSVVVIVASAVDNFVRRRGIAPTA